MRNIEKTPEQIVEGKMITLYAAMTLPIVIKILEDVFKEYNIEYKMEGKAWKTMFHLKKGDNGAEFFLDNLLLEIVTVDRDEVPLRFNKKILESPQNWMDKTMDILESKLAMLLPMLDGMSKEEIIAHVQQQGAGKYERIRIIEVDAKQIKENQKKEN